MKHILITGISGFVGTSLVNYFHGKKDIIIHGYSRDIQSAHHLLSAYSIDFVPNFSAETLDNLQIDVVIHLAGIAHDLSGRYKEQDYQQANYELTKKIYDEFAKSHAKTFVFISSVKAVVDHTDQIIDEDFSASPTSAYGLSKRQAETYILSHEVAGKLNYILRPCMIHGPGNKGNLNMLYKFIHKGIPYPLGAFENKRSFLSIDNFCFVIDKIIEGKLKGDIYLLADSEPVSTNRLVRIIGEVLNNKVKIVRIPKPLIEFLARIGSWIHAPFNTSTVAKLCENMVVSNEKLLLNLNETLPVAAEEGLNKTIRSFNE